MGRDLYTAISIIRRGDGKNETDSAFMAVKISTAVKED